MILILNLLFESLGSYTEGERAEIANLFIEIGKTGDLITHFDKFNIQEEKLRLEILKRIIESGGAREVARDFWVFKIKEEKSRIEIAKLIIENGEAIQVIQNLRSFMTRSRVGILRLLIESGNGIWVARNLHKLKIKEESSRLEVAKLIIENGEAIEVAYNFSKFQIKNKGAIDLLCRLMLESDPSIINLFTDRLTKEESSCGGIPLHLIFFTDGVPLHLIALCLTEILNHRLPEKKGVKLLSRIGSFEKIDPKAGEIVRKLIEPAKESLSVFYREQKQSYFLLGCRMVEIANQEQDSSKHFKKLLLTIIVTLLLSANPPDGIIIEKVLQYEGLLEGLFSITNPKIQTGVARVLVETLQSKSSQDFLQNCAFLAPQYSQGIKQKKLANTRLLVWMTLNSCWQSRRAFEVAISIDDSFITHKKRDLLLEVLGMISACRLPADKRKQLLDQIFISDLNINAAEMVKLLKSIKALLCLGCELDLADLLTGDLKTPVFKCRIDEVVSKKFFAQLDCPEKKSLEDFFLRHGETSREMRDVTAIKRYAARLATLPPDERAQLLHLMGDFVLRVIEGDFKAWRCEPQNSPEHFVE